MEARVGIEPTNAAFAEPCLTTWLPRLRGLSRRCALFVQQASDARKFAICWAMVKPSNTIYDSLGPSSCGWLPGFQPVSVQAASR